MATGDIAKAIGGDGETLWNSISKYVSVVDTIGGASDKDDSTVLGINNAQKSVSEDDPQCKSKGVTNEVLFARLVGKQPLAAQCSPLIRQQP